MPEILLKYFESADYQNGVEKSQCISIQCGGHSISLPFGMESYPEHTQVYENLTVGAAKEQKFNVLTLRISGCSALGRINDV